MEDLREQNQKDYAIDGTCNFNYDLELVRNAISYFEWIR
jgi:hypothetical protein